MSCVRTFVENDRLVLFQYPSSRLSVHNATAEILQDTGVATVGQFRNTAQFQCAVDASFFSQ